MRKGKILWTISLLLAFWGMIAAGCGLLGENKKAQEGMASVATAVLRWKSKRPSISLLAESSGCSWNPPCAS